METFAFSRSKHLQSVQLIQYLIDTLYLYSDIAVSRFCSPFPDFVAALLLPWKFTPIAASTVMARLKFRLYLKSLSGVAQQGGIPNSYFGPLEQNRNHGSLGRFDIQAVAASGQIPLQTLPAVHAEFLGRPTDSKTLYEEKREELYENLKTNESIGWEVDVIDPRTSQLKC
ncbi:hypothetical protein Vadar_029205 [Vaccinium darrowii]|uniref:Uncharacterized protein n=1 Tax=Vaccinium darrowii TaxID=229202 RepID=A0ACB7YZF7_9ERIC|nr:hypothetical protein Vadar_029205 [Vaccinium darrowii]